MLRDRRPSSPFHVKCLPKSVDVHVHAIRIPIQINQLLLAFGALKTPARALKMHFGEQDENRPQDSESTFMKKDGRAT